MTDRILTALHYRAAMSVVALPDLPRIVARYVRLVWSMERAERAEYLRRAAGMLRSVDRREARS